jgi:NhaA family Na+:H+ antiporter
MKLSSMPEGLNLRNMTGAGFLGGIGFTMSIFITLLAFNEKAMIGHSKIAIMLCSVLAGVAGFVILKFSMNDRADS